MKLCIIPLTLGIFCAMSAKDLGAREASRSNRSPITRTAQPTQVGMASWYGTFHAGRKTANGERFDPRKLTAAHRTLPLGSVVRVTCIETEKSVVLTVNDRGPYVASRRRDRSDHRIIDISEGAAKRLDFRDDGLCRVRVEVLSRPERVVEVAEEPEGRRRR